jgi:hypothetical protein
MIWDLRLSNFYPETKLREMFPRTYIDDHSQQGLTKSVYLLVKSAKSGIPIKHHCLSNINNGFFSRISNVHEIENDGLYRIINVNMIVKPSIFVMECKSKDNDPVNNIIILSDQAGWSAKAFQQDNNLLEDTFMNCDMTNGKPQPYFLHGKPDHCVRYVCNAKGLVTSKPRKKLVLYRNEAFTLD